MNTIIFDGKKRAIEVEEKLTKVSIAGNRAKAVSIQIGDNEKSSVYLNLKKSAAKRLGVDFEILTLSERVAFEELKSVIEKLNNDNSVFGIMIQLPMPRRFSNEKKLELISFIKKKKDIDGMRGDSYFKTPVIASIMHVFEEALSKVNIKDDPIKVLIVGSKGFVGGKLICELYEYQKKDLLIKGVDKGFGDLKAELKNADVVISTTGIKNLINGKDLKACVVAIDVGSPWGDFEKESVLGKASFLSPVPGGVGPLTISYLLKNLIEARSNYENK